MVILDTNILIAILAGHAQTNQHLYTYDHDFLKLGKRWVHVLDYV